VKKTGEAEEEEDDEDSLNLRLFVPEEYLGFVSVGKGFGSRVAQTGLCILMCFVPVASRKLDFLTKFDAHCLKSSGGSDGAQACSHKYGLTSVNHPVVCTCGSNSSISGGRGGGGGGSGGGGGGGGGTSSGACFPKWQSAVEPVIPWGTGIAQFV
jgi:uncharacterized membrane protein YgcG